MTLFNKFTKFIKIFPSSASSPNSRQTSEFSALDNMLQDGFQNLRDNISLALLSHMRAELRYRINEFESPQKHNHPIEKLPKFSGSFSLPLTRTALFIFSLTTIFSLVWLSDSAHYNQQSALVQNNKTLIARKDNRMYTFLSPLIAGSLFARQNLLEQANPLLTHFENAHKKRKLRKMAKNLWLEDKEKVRIQNTFAPIPHQLSQSQANERNGFFVHDYLPQKQLNFIAVGYNRR